MSGYRVTLYLHLNGHSHKDRFKMARVAYQHKVAYMGTY